MESSGEGVGAGAVSDKMTCPGCGAHSSSVLIKVNDGEPCPFCGLSADAITEITDVRRRKADEDLKARLEKMLVERDRAVAEAAKLNRVLYAVRRAIGCEKPYAPHEGMDPEP
jgi:uncharacterized Zn finger protein (UPF0148 family)